MKKYLYLVFFLFMLGTISCNSAMSEEEIASIGIVPCRKAAPFISSIGFDANRSAFSTNHTRYKGIILMQAPANAQDTSYKVYQDSTWSQYGYMGSITTDEAGNVYSFAVPFINTLEQTMQSLNTIYVVNNETGKMKPFLKLPIGDSTAGIVAYGLLGIYYDCHGKKLYAATVSGSTRDEEKGIIYAIDVASASIVDKLSGVDAMALCVGGVTGKKLLYFGKARSTDIYTIELDKEGNFIGKPELAINMDQLGPRGDDKARRIRFDKNGYMQVHGIEFNFSLAGQGEKPETLYQFGYNAEDKKWILMNSK